MLTIQAQIEVKLLVSNYIKMVALAKLIPMFVLSVITTLLGQLFIVSWCKDQYQLNLSENPNNSSCDRIPECFLHDRCVQ